MYTMLNPIPLYEYTKFAKILLAAATVILRLCLSSCNLHCIPRYANQY